MLIDTHCHLNLDAYDHDRPDVLRRAIRGGIRRIVVPSIDLDSISAVLALADKHDCVYGAVGIHPNDIPHNGDVGKILSVIKQASDRTKVVAIGEIGLDYHWDSTPREAQRKWLTLQLNIAAECELPVILHNRSATPDILGIVRDWHQNLHGRLKETPGVFHSVSMRLDDAIIALEMGFMLGFTGPVTYKSGEDMRLVSKMAPLGQILVETDGPFLPPAPHRGERNEPSFVTHVLARIAEIRGIRFEEAARATCENACRLFDWELSDI